MRDPKLAHILVLLVKNWSDLKIIYNSWVFILRRQLKKLKYADFIVKFLHLRQQKKGITHDIDIDIPIESKMINPRLFNISAKTILEPWHSRQGFLSLT